MKNIVDIVLISSKQSSACKKFERRIRKEGLDFIKVIVADTLETRKILKDRVNLVPCVVVVYENNGVIEYDTFEADDAEEWLEELLENKRKEQTPQQEPTQSAAPEPQTQNIPEPQNKPSQDPSKKYTYINLDDSHPQESQQAPPPQQQEPIRESSRANNIKSADLLSKAREMEKMRQQEFNKKPTV